ncbi:aldo/keto reductase, partial [Staphylococcus saprophyticus]|nr:aldo/keto reductase [Staphylococcus saprophyticus]
FYDLIDTLQEIATQHQVSVAQVTLAWLRDRPNVDSLVLAARTKAQLQDNIASYNLQLTSNEIKTITELTTPEPIYPLWHRAMNAYDKASD